jgi:hypothetical protein
MLNDANAPAADTAKTTIEIARKTFDRAGRIVNKRKTVSVKGLEKALAKLHDGDNFEIMTSSS